MTRNRAFFSTVLLTLFLVGCANTVTLPSDVSGQVPEWFKDKQRDNTNADFPNISAMPTTAGEGRPGNILKAQLPYAEQIDVNFNTHPRAKPYLGGQAAIIEIRRTMLEDTGFRIPSPVEHINDTELARIKTLLDSK